MFEEADPTRVIDEVLRLGVEAVGDTDLVEAMRAARSVIAAAEGVVLGAVAELSRRRRREHELWLAERRGRRLAPAERGGAPADVDEVDRFSAAEVGVALGLSHGSARSLQSLAVDLAERLPGTLAALAAGRLDRAHAQAVSEAAVGLDRDGCVALEADLLPRVLPDDTVAPVALPGVLDENGEPLVVTGGPGREGAVVCGLTRVQLAGRVRRTVMRVDRSAARRRAEAARSCRGVRAWGTEDGMGVLQVTGPSATVAAAWARVDALARDKQDQARAELRRLQEEERAARCGADDRAADGGDPLRALPTLDNLRADTVLELLAGTHDLRELPSPLVQVHVDVTVPLPGLADGGTAPGCAEPAEVVGMGPITVEEARDLLADARWRMLVPAVAGPPGTGVAGAVHAAPGPCRAHRESGPGPYALPVRLARAVRARDVTCRFPGCTRAARRCDADHTVPHPHGPTAMCNNACLCRFHHRLKHRGGWHVEQLPGGVLRWTSPTGRTATTRPPSLEDPAPAGWSVEKSRGGPPPRAPSPVSVSTACDAARRVAGPTPEADPPWVRAGPPPRPDVA